MSDVYYGQQQPSSGTSDLNAQQFIFQRLLTGVWTCMPVQVMAVTNDGGVSAIGTVDIQPLVHQIDGNGNATPHKTIYGANYLRVQGGKNAIILDPQVNDIGIAVFAQRDMSALKASVSGGQNQNSGVATVPGSRRTFSASDAIYLYTIMTLTQNPDQTPDQYIQFNTDGIQVVSPNSINFQSPDTNQVVHMKNDGTMELTSGSKITVKAPNIKLDGDVEITGDLTGDKGGTFSNDVTADGTSVHSHTHGGVQTGTGNTGAPN